METRVQTQPQDLTRPRVSWNKGKLIGQKAPLKLKEIYAIRIRLQLEKRVRELALFNLAIDSKLRGWAARKSVGGLGVSLNGGGYRLPRFCALPLKNTFCNI